MEKATRTRMSHADAAWLHMDRPGNLVIVHAVLWFDEPLDWDRVRGVLRERLLDRYPRFRQRVVRSRLGMPRWEEVEVDLDAHVRPVTLPPPGGKRGLETLVGRLMSRPLDPARPLWEVCLVHGYDGGSAVVFRAHHCVADGIALVGVLLSLTDGPVPPPRTGTAVPGRFPASGRGPVAATVSILGHLVSYAREAARLVLLPPDHRTALRARTSVPKQAAWSDPVPLERLRMAGPAHGATVNDVLLSALAGSLRALLRRHGQAVARVRALLPFNLRPLDRPPPAGLGNRFGLVFFDLPVGEGDRRGRLAVTARRTRALKGSPQGAVAYAIINGIGMLSPRLQRRIVDWFAGKGSVVVTNVPGPRGRVSLAGVPLRGLVAWVPRSGHVGMGVALVSYAGEVTVGLAVDAGTVPDPARVLADLEGEIAALAPAAAPRAPVPA